MLAFGVFRERTHSIQLRMFAEVCGSPLVSAAVETASTLSLSGKLGSRFGCMPHLGGSLLAVSPPSGVTVCLSISIIPAFE